MNLDKMDIAIISELRKNSRITYKELAKEVGSNINTVASRIKRLEKNRYILGYLANINYDLVGFKTSALIKLIVDNANSLNSDSLSDIVSLPNASIVYGMTGAYDLNVVVMAKDFDELVDAVGSVVKNKHIVKSRSEIIVKEYKNIDEFNPFIDGNSAKLHTYRKRKKPLDELDLGILRELRSNANAPLRVLSSKLKKPISTIKERTDRLEANGIIKGFVANVNFGKLGYWGSGLLSIKLECGMINDEKIAEQVRSIPEVGAMFRVLGDYDLYAGYLAKDTEHANSIIKRVSNIPGVKKVDPSVSLMKLKSRVDFNPLADDSLKSEVRK